MTDLEQWMWERVRRPGETRRSTVGLFLIVLEARQKAAKAGTVKG